MSAERTEHDREGSKGNGVWATQIKGQFGDGAGAGCTSTGPAVALAAAAPLLRWQEQH
jgi:hypothetical protein